MINFKILSKRRFAPQIANEKQKQQDLKKSMTAGSQSRLLSWQIKVLWLYQDFYHSFVKVSIKVLMKVSMNILMKVLIKVSKKV